MATWPTCGQSDYITPANFGVSNAQREEENQKWLCCPHVGEVATSPLLSWGSPTLSWGPQRLAWGQNLETATWVTCGQSGSITPAILGVSNTPREDKNQKWLRGPHVGKVATSPLPSWGSPTLSPGPKIRNGYWPTFEQSGYITPAVLGVPNAVLGSATLSAGTKPRNGYGGHVWAKWLHHPCRLEGL